MKSNLLDVADDLILLKDSGHVNTSANILEHNCGKKGKKSKQDNIRVQK